MQKGIIGEYLNMMVQIAKDVLITARGKKYEESKNNEIKTGNLSILERSAVLAFSKIMCVSNKICSENIVLLFDLTLTQSLDKVIRANLIIAIGDLY